MANIFSLFGEILIDNTNANKSIDTTTEKAEKGGVKIGDAFGKIAKGAVKIGTAAVGAAAAFGTAAFKMASDTSEAADHIDKMAQKIGLSREAYQEWDYIMAQNGMSIDSLQTGIKSLNSLMTKAAEGNADAAATFEALGVSVTNADGSLRSQEEVMEDTIAALQGMKSGADRAALATKLFGKAGSEMAPLLNETAESTEALRQQAHELGMVMSDEMIDSGVTFDDTLETVKRALGGLMNQLGAVALPIITQILNLIISKMPDIQALFSRLTPILEALFNGILPPLFDLVDTLLPVILDLIGTLLPLFQEIIQAILPVIINLIQLLLPFIIQIVEQILPIAIQLIQAIMPFVSDILNTVLPLLIELMQALLPPLIQIIDAILPVVLDLIRTLLPIIIQIVSDVFPVLIDLVNLIMPVLVQIVEKVMPVIIQLIEQLLPIILQIIDQVLPVLLQLFDAIMPILTQLIDMVLPVITSLLDALMPVLQPILELLSTLLSPLTELLNLILPPLVDLLSDLGEYVLPLLQTIMETLGPVITDIFGAAFESLGDIVKTITEIFGGLIDFIGGIFAGDWERAWDGIVRIFKGIFNLIPTFVEGVINGAIGLINGILKGINAVTGLIGIPEIPMIPKVTLPRLRIGLDYVPYDDFPALLHKGEMVLTQSEAKEYAAKTAAAAAESKEKQRPIVQISLSDKAIYVEHLDGEDPESLEELTDRLMEIIAEKINREEAIFA